MGDVPSLVCFQVSLLSCGHSFLPSVLMHMSLILTWEPGLRPSRQDCRRPRLCACLYFAKEKRQMHCDHVFLFLLWPNRGTELAFPLSNSLHMDAAQKASMFLSVSAKQLLCASKRLWHLVSGESQGPRCRV